MHMIFLYFYFIAVVQKHVFFLDCIVIFYLVVVGLDVKKHLYAYSIYPKY